MMGPVTVESALGVPLSARYPGTPYWPWSPAIGGDDDVHPDPARFVDESVVVTEKLDGGNTLLHAGKVYARSVAAPVGRQVDGDGEETPRMEGERAGRLSLR